jgi:S-adenosylmethionine:tRNA-ribosyltransferase-isomerase (queuine synthetase)
MKNTLWIFGDSTSDELTPKNLNDNFDFRTKYYNYKGFTPKVFGQIISETLNLDYKNNSGQGFCNDSIFQSICDVSDQIKKEDILIINWTSITRFRMISKINVWTQIVPNFNVDIKLFNNISNNTINEILINRDNDLYVNDVNSKIKLIKNAYKDNIIINWTPFTHKFDVEKNFNFNNFETIFKETSGEINDYHFSENGHLKLTDYLLSIIDQKMNKKLI